ncbi:MAG: hypothetical protein ABFS14_02890 [Gemmatimonadota bacterium]
MSVAKEIKVLLGENAEPAFSLYVPLGPGYREGHANRLRLREAIRGAIRVLAGGGDARTFNKLARQLEAAVAPGLLSSESGTLAVFHSPNVNTTYHLPVVLPEQVYVGQNFHIKPLLSFVLAEDRFWLLELSRGSARLWAGDATEISPVQVNSLPTSPEQVLGYEYARDYEIVHRGAHALGPGTARAAATAFSGHGMGANDRDDEALQFFRAVDDALVSELQGSESPVILAATPENEALYRSVSQLPNLAGEGIRAAIRDWDLDKIHGSARSITAKAAETAVDEARQLWEVSYGRGAAESDPAAIARYAVAGRIRLLMAERGRQLWGTLDRDTGAVSVQGEDGEDPGPAAMDILDELIELAILHGGRVLLVSADSMPVQTGVAAILR